MPLGNAVLHHRRASSSTRDFDLLVEARIGAGRADDCAQSAVGKLKRCGCHVLDLDSLVGDGSGVRGYRCDRTDEPVEEINRVDRLVHQCSTAVDLPRSVPIAGRVVLVGAKVASRGAGDNHGAERAAVDQLLHRPRAAGKPRLEDSGAEDPGLLACRDDTVAPLRGNLQGLFYHHMLSRGRGGEGRFEMSA